MNKLYTFLIFILFFSRVDAQQFEWVQSTPVNYSMNPSLVDHCIANSVNGVVSSRLDSGRYIYGQDVLGPVIIESLNHSGVSQWTYLLSDTALVRFITTDLAGDIYVAGRFIGTMNLNGTDVLNNSSVSPNENDFILKLSSSGTLIWKKNLNQDGNFFSITAFSCDQQNNLWYCMSDFMQSKMYKTDINGDITDSLLHAGVKWVSGISFDAFGACYISGAAEGGTITIGGLSVSSVDPYLMYAARYNSNLDASWIYLSHDITFQRPLIVTDLTGGAYLSGPIYDSCIWGNQVFQRPQWSADFFLTRIDSTGNFLWGRQGTITPTIQGRFSTAALKFLDVDNTGNALLYGTLNGSMDWGNGVSVTGTPGFDQLHVVAFDKTNIAIWEKTGEANGNYPTCLLAGPSGTIYGCGGITGVAVFDSISVNAGGTFASFLFKINSTSVGINDYETSSSNIYPNPSSGIIHLPEEWIGKTLFVYDLQGRQTKSILLSAATLNLDDLNLEEGIYILNPKMNKKGIKVILN